MADRFLDEIKRMHRMRDAFRELSPEDRAKLVAQFGDEAAEDWVIKARDAQLPPLDLDWCWLFLAGRGAGKSHAMAGAIHSAIRAGIQRIHLIAPTLNDVFDVNIEGPAGIMAACAVTDRPRWVTSRHRLEWNSGATVTYFSAEEPESLRGQQCSLVVIDEIARMRHAQAVFDQAQFGCRLGDKPRTLIATTPRSTPFMKRLVQMDGVSITTGSTYDNARHLSPTFLKRIRDLYENTRLGRQELTGMMIVDPEFALFKDDWLIHDDVNEELIEQVSIGVDPSGGGDEIGIVACALLHDGRLAVLADRSTSGSPGTWGDAVVKAHDEFDADDVVVETNFGGVMAAEVIKQTAERIHYRGERESNLIRVKEVNASRGKVLRAEPVSLLYEKGRVLHRRGLNLLEAEMMAFSRDWDRATDGSPNRLDALVWALSRLSRVVVHIPIA